MANFQELFCVQHNCTKEQFGAKVFWRCLYPHAFLVAPLILLFNYEYFSADRDLIAAAGRTEDIKHVRIEVRDYFWASNNTGWLRRTCNIRISGQRLKNLARRYLPEGELLPVLDDGSSPPH